MAHAHKALQNRIDRVKSVLRTMREPKQKIVERMKIDGVLRTIQEVDRRIAALYERGQDTKNWHLCRNHSSGERHRIVKQK